MSCPTLRRKRIEHRAINWRDGSFIEGSLRVEWRDEICGAPLFSDDGAICKSCVAGWAVAENFPLDRVAEFLEGAAAAGDPRAIETINAGGAS